MELSVKFAWTPEARVWIAENNERYTGAYIYTLQEEERREDRWAKPNAIRIESALPQIISKPQYF